MFFDQNVYWRRIAFRKYQHASVQRLYRRAGRQTCSSRAHNFSQTPSFLPSFQLRPSGLPKPRAGSMAATTPLAQTRGTIQTNLSKTGPLRRVRKSRHGRIFQTALAGKWRVGSWRRWSPSPLLPTPLPNTLIVSSPPRELKACSSALLFIKAPTGRTSTELLHLSTDASVGGEMR